jgi:hypothetical protein
MHSNLHQLVAQQRHVDDIRAARRATRPSATESRRRLAAPGSRVLAALRRRTGPLEPVVNRW